MEPFDLNALIVMLLPMLRRSSRSSITFKPRKIASAFADKALIEAAIIKQVIQATLGTDTTIETCDTGTHLHVIINGVCEVRMNTVAPSTRKESENFQ